jgi:uncharacterized membrane protein
MKNHAVYIKSSKVHRGGRWYSMWPVWGLLTFLVLLFAFNLTSEYITDLPQKSDIKAVSLGEGQDVHLQTSKLNSTPLHLFEVNASGKKAKLVVQQTEDKSIHVAIASCRACYRSRSRHYTQHGQMMCGECNMPMNFESKGHNSATDRCSLIELPHTESDGEVAVLARDVFAQVAKIPQ